MEQSRIDNNNNDERQYKITVWKKKVTFRGYHTAVFILARISSPSVDNCPSQSRRQLSSTAG